MKNEKEIRRYLSVIKRAVSYIEGMLEDDGGIMEELIEETEKKAPVVFETRPVRTPPRPAAAQEIPEDRAAFISHLLQMKDWPEAIPTFLAVNQFTPEEEMARAKSILDKILDRSVSGLNVLDFGCGDGWITRELKNRGATVVGYDIVRSAKWSNDVIFVDSLQRLSGRKFDVVILYDVLDHCVRPEEAMTQIRSVMASDAVVYVRCHPWTSKHATHIFRLGLNKAYAHLILRPEEIMPLLTESVKYTRPDINPIVSYHHFFRQFQILKEIETREKVPEFFSAPAIKKAMLGEQGVTEGYAEKFWDIIQIQFVDYVLKAA